MSTQAPNSNNGSSVRDPGAEGPADPAPAIPAAVIPCLEGLEERLGHRFGDRMLLLEAITHPSRRETAKLSYERLEFLGDAVLGMVVAEYLFKKFPAAPEGELTRVKSSVVSRAALSRLGRGLGITESVLLGKGMKCQPTLPRSVTADATEAVLGALYLDGGLQAARQFIISRLENRMKRTTRTARALNHKSRLQHLTQRLGQGTPSYRVISSSGPDHERVFEVRAIVGDREFSSCTGNSKKMAEQLAARTALQTLRAELDEQGPADS